MNFPFNKKFSLFRLKIKIGSQKSELQNKNFTIKYHLYGIMAHLLLHVQTKNKETPLTFILSPTVKESFLVPTCKENLVLHNPFFDLFYYFWFVFKFP